MKVKLMITHANGNIHISDESEVDEEDYNNGLELVKQKLNYLNIKIDKQEVIFKSAYIENCVIRVFVCE